VIRQQSRVEEKEELAFGIQKKDSEVGAHTSREVSTTAVRGLDS